MKKFYIAFIALFLAMIILPSAFVFLGEDRSFSDNENRMLQTAPELSGADVLSGRFQEKLTDYISDQFPARDVWTQLGTQIKKAAGFRDIGGAYLGSDGYYMEKITPESVDERKFALNLGLMNDFAKECGVPTSALLVTATGTVMSDKLPAHAVMYDAGAMYDTACAVLTDISVPDLYSALSADKSEQLYYRTDHHWTWYGAYTAYRAYMPDGAYEGQPELFSDSFLGTTYSKTLDPAAQCDCVYIAPVADTVKVNADGSDADFYYTAAATEKDKYKVFQGGNYGQIRISGGCDNGKTLLIIKDSFANSLVPFLTADFENIIMLDMRYYVGSAKQLVSDEGVDEILFVSEMSSLASDNNMVKLGF